MQTLHFTKSTIARNPGIESADWTDRPEEILRAIDEQLKDYGLEIGLYDFENACLWKIVPRSNP